MDGQTNDSIIKILFANVGRDNLTGIIYGFSFIYQNMSLKMEKKML